MKKTVILILFMFAVLLPCREKSVTLRSRPKALVSKDIKAMFARYNFFDKRMNPEGAFENSFEAKNIRGDQVVIDRATGLMWHWSGSSKPLEIEYLGKRKVEQWLKELNQKGYAGFKDWRLPTLEEALTLLEPLPNSEKKHLDIIFSQKQYHIWTGDTYQMPESMSWSKKRFIGVNFSYFKEWKRHDPSIFGVYVKPVRTLK